MFPHGALQFLDCRPDRANWFTKWLYFLELPPLDRIKFCKELGEAKSREGMGQVYLAGQKKTGPIFSKIKK